MTYPYTIYDGVNSTAIDRDEYNGAGSNAPIDMVWWDSAEVVVPLLAQAGFWDDVDLCVRAEKRLATVRPEKTLLCVGDD